MCSLNTTAEAPDLQATLFFSPGLSPAILSTYHVPFLPIAQYLLYFAITKSSQILPSHIELPLSFRK